MRTLLHFLLVSGLSSYALTGASPTIRIQLPTLPQSTPNSTYPTVTGQSTAVHAGTDLQAAIDNAQCGDELVLDAGTTWQGNYTLPNKNCTGGVGTGGWVVIRSSASGSLPPHGTRATATDVGNMATLCTSNSNSAITNVPSMTTPSIRAASFYWIEGLEITACAGYNSTLYNAVDFSMPTGLGEPAGPPEDDTIAGMPHDIVFSHDYIHGIPQMPGMIRGLFLDGYNYTVIDSTINNWQDANQDSQAIFSDCSTGNFLIQNNDLEASADSFLIGAPECALVPANITVRHNYFTKPQAWYGVFITKNNIEFKNGQYILVDSNVIVGGYNGAQPGTGVAATPRTSTGSEPPGTWASVAQVNDLSVTHNVMRGPGLGVVLGSKDSNCTPAMHCLESYRAMFQNNLIVTGTKGAENWCFQVDTPIDLTLDHNTCVTPAANTVAFFVDSYPVTNAQLTNNVFTADAGGQCQNGPIAFLANTTGVCNANQNTGGIATNNGGVAPIWSLATLLEWQQTTAIGTLMSPTSPFMDTTHYAIIPGSVFSGAGTDGSDLGWSAHSVNQNNVIQGLPN